MLTLPALGVCPVHATTAELAAGGARAAAVGLPSALAALPPPAVHNLVIPRRAGFAMLVVVIVSVLIAAEGNALHDDERVHFLNALTDASCALQCLFPARHLVLVPHGSKTDGAEPTGKVHSAAWYLHSCQSPFQLQIHLAYASPAAACHCQSRGSQLHCRHRRSAPALPPHRRDPFSTQTAAARSASIKAALGDQGHVAGQYEVPPARTEHSTSSHQMHLLYDEHYYAQAQPIYGLKQVATGAWLSIHYTSHQRRRIAQGSAVAQSIV